MMKPCGQCDVGIYSESAMLNKTALRFALLSPDERVAAMPQCKSEGGDCGGARDFHAMILAVETDGISKSLVNPSTISK